MRFSLKVFSLLFSVLILVSLFNVPYLSQKGKNLFYLLSLPFNRWLWREGNSFSMWLKGFSNRRELIRENELLKSKLKKAVEGKERLKALEKENEVLRKSLSLKKRNDKFQFLLSRVVLRKISSDEILINSGSEDNLKIGQVVITPDDELVGKVSQVFPNFALVSLLTKKGFRFDVQLGKEGTYALAEGEGHSSLRLLFLKKDKNVFQGEDIFTTEAGGNFPSLLLVGKVQSAEKNDISSFQNVKARPSFETGRLSFVFVIKNFIPWQGK